MIALEEFNRLIGLPEHNRLEERDAVAWHAGSWHGGPVICPCGRSGCRTVVLFAPGNPAIQERLYVRSG